MWNKIDVSSKEVIESYYKNNNMKVCDYSINNLLIWSQGDELEYKEENGTLFIRGNYLKERAYFMPLSISSNVDKVIEGIDSILEQGYSVELIPEEWKERLEENIKERYLFEEQEDSKDYIYLFEDLAELKGRKFSKKRNHLNHFVKNYDYKYKPISKENIHDILEFQEEWMKKREGFDCYELVKEDIGIKTLLNNYEALNLIGGVLYVDKKVVAYTLGESVYDEMILIHIEKANAEILGSYQGINSIFLRENRDKFIYVNREDDAGSIGLRTAKLSYFPDKFLKKYRITSRKKEQISL